MVPPNGHLFRREFGVVNELSKKIKGEVDRYSFVFKSGFLFSFAFN